MNLKNLRVFVTVLALLAGVTAALYAKSKADQLYKQGQAAEAKGDWDTALDDYLKALDLKPGDTEYTVSMRKARFQAGEKHIKAGQKLRSEGKLQEALGEFQKALIADPSSSIAIQEMKRTQDMMKQSDTKPDERGMTPVERSRRETEQRMESIMGPPELKPTLRTVGPLKINNQPMKVIYDTIGKLAGVNVLFDAQFTPPNRNFNLELNQSSPEQAFDYLAVLTHTFWKPISSNAVFVTEDNPTKHRDFDDEVVKTFYVTNVTSPQEFQEIATAIRSIGDIRRVFTYTAQKAIIVRAPVDSIALAEKLVHDLDKPKAEVVVDMIVMQANSSRVRDLAASLVSASGTAGLNVPFVFNPTNPVTVVTTSGASGATGATGTIGGGTTTTTTTTPTTGSLVGLNQLRHLSSSDFATSLPGGLLNLMLTDSRTKVTNSPTLRVSDGMKAELKIGLRIPYATGSFQPGVGTVGVSPLVSTQFNFIDTGVNVTIQPQVHSESEVTLHVEVDVSTVAQYINLGGLSQPEVSQNKNNADIRLREGEVTILGGLSQLSDIKTIAGIPGLVDIPALGSTLFGSNHTEKDKGELLIALIPHIVRTPGYTEENLRGIFAGTGDSVVKLSYAPRPEPSASTPPPAANPPAPPPSTPGAPARIVFAPAAIQAATGGNITVAVQLENASDLFSGSPIKIKFDPSQLRLNDIGPGDLFTRDGTRVTSAKDIRNDSGEATLTVSRFPGSAGANGSGAIAVLNFVAVGKGTSTISVIDSSLKNSQGQAIQLTPAEAQVKLQ